MINEENSIDDILGIIKKYRNEKGYSNETMGHQLDISPSTYNKIERNEVKLTVDRLLSIMSFLEIPAESLFKTSKKVFNQANYDNSIGYVERFYQENKELYSMLLQGKDDIINQLKAENERLRND